MAPKLQKRCSEAAAAVAAVEGSRADSDLTPKPKKGRLDLTGLVAPKQAEHTMEEVEKAFSEAVKKHPFHDNADHTIDFHTASVFRDAKGKICGVLLPGALPSFAAAMAADVLRPAATKTSLRSNMFGGQAPLSGIAGYFDYRGSPVELKCRKTSFTHEHVQLWPGVFPMIEYVSAIYKAVLPEHWAAQDAAVPDVVRIHGSPFSTLTINQRFRTASHTDAGDFDMGYGVLAVLEGNFKGLSLALDDFGVCFRMQPRDVLLFNTHFFHSNTEPEVNHPKDDWDRLTCVFYYRAALGEASCVTEYKRRLVRAREIGAVPPPVVDAIVQKDNGDNFNKPAPTFPPQLTPFGGAAGVLSLHSCVTKLQRLHELLLEKPEFGVVLFGEPLRTDDGLLPRGKEQLIPVHLPVVVKAPPSGGFTEASDVLKAAEERQYFFEEENLANELGPELVGMWSKSRALWLQLVKEDWERLLRNNPERTRFNWNNTSAMNAAFFDLCEVAKQMMLGILDNENPSKAEEQSFWMLFAAHLNTACATEIGMPRDAMGMRKLNVKLKDFHFGGTRYLKDMPPEEQQRRLERKRQIEEARRRGCVSRVAHTSGWLQNDAFDYQHEDREVDFEKNGWVRPEENAQRLSLAPCANGVTAAADPTERIHLLVVLPRRAASGQGANRNVPTTMSDEAARLLKNPAAQRLLAGPCRNGAVTSPLSFGCVTITFVFDGDDVSDVDADFVILQHVLAAMESDEEAEARISFWASLAKHCVFIIEADTMDRHHYLLREEVRVAYEDVAAACFTTLHAAAYCTDSVHVRRTPSLLALTKSKGVEFRYKFIGSPLNTVALLVRGSS
ncbi:DnaJ chaperone protein [Trypanosoma grayi]|uniref:DnaJ chaperone protein n=1 Tax=Trypanosoma grayi TaxID=71804 RepID=UPI0004F420F2|nr:DnaJ chaperone protein [Trypanosoma grayi]KEG12004.1 DnaJ chaperone protein [Trypanosoma grayi]